MNYIKTLIFLIAVPGSVLVHIPNRIGRSRKKDRGRAFARGTGLAAVVAWAGGGGLLLWSMWNFASRGRGSPSPAAPPEELVVEGPYRYVRNPMYWGAALLLLGQWLWWGSGMVLAYSLAVISAFHLFIVLYEEPNLEKRFGEAYRRYRARVPRWLPTLFPAP